MTDFDGEILADRIKQLEALVAFLVNVADRKCPDYFAPCGNTYCDAGGRVGGGICTVGCR